MRHLRWRTIGIVLLLITVSTFTLSVLSIGERAFAKPGMSGEYVVQVQPDVYPSEAGTTAPPVSRQEAFSQTITRTISTNAGGFLFDTTSTDIRTTTYLGLRWAAGSTDEAGFYMRRPADWDGTSPIEITITFALGGSQAGAVNWRLKLNTYTPNSGEWLTNPGTRDADTILTFADGPSWYRIYSQTFTLTPADFNEEPYWSLYFLRGSGANGETFTGDLYVMGADVAYQALLPADLLYLPLIVR